MIYNRTIHFTIYLKTGRIISSAIGNIDYFNLILKSINQFEGYDRFKIFEQKKEDRNFIKKLLNYYIKIISILIVFFILTFVISFITNNILFLAIGTIIPFFSSIIFLIILYYYYPKPDESFIRSHLRQCPKCKTQFSVYDNKRPLTTNCPQCGIKGELT